MAFCVLEHEDLSIELKLLLLVPCQLTAYEAGTKEPVPRPLERLRPNLFLSSFLLLFTKYVSSSKVPQVNYFPVRLAFVKGTVLKVALLTP
jgi:hypothetical protein